MSHTLTATSPHFAYADPADTIDTSYINALHAGDPYFNTDPVVPVDPIEDTTFTDFITCILIPVSIVALIWIISRIRIAYRLHRDPAFRAKYLSDQAYLKRRASDMRKIEQQRRQEEKQRRQRALNSMTTKERLLYEQNKTLNNIYWLTFWQGLSGRRKR